MLRTTTWVRENWGDFKELVDLQQEPVVISRRGKLVAVAMRPDAWGKGAIRKTDSEVRNSLAEVWRNAVRGVATVSESVHGGFDTVVIAPASVLDDDEHERYARQAREHHVQQRRTAGAG